MSPALTRTETERLLDQLETLLADRDHAIGILERLAPTFVEVRHALNELHRTINRR